MQKWKSIFAKWKKSSPFSIPYPLPSLARPSSSPSPRPYPIELSPIALPAYLRIYFLKMDKKFVYLVHNSYLCAELNAGNHEGVF